MKGYYYNHTTFFSFADLEAGRRVLDKQGYQKKRKLKYSKLLVSKLGWIENKVIDNCKLRYLRANKCSEER